jgi:hypothetical protein
MINDEEWRQKIFKLWGVRFFILELSNLSLDENIGLARVLQDGVDPYAKDRKSKAQEIGEILSQPGRKNWIRQGDEPFLELLKTGLINYPPQNRLDLLRLMNSGNFSGPYQSEKK